MPKPPVFEGNLVLPVITAPMFLVSGPELVIAACKSGVVGSFPAPNARDIDQLDGWLQQITEELETYKKENPDITVAPFAVNLIVHMMNGRLDQELELIEKYNVPFVITSVGNPKKAVEKLKPLGTVVFHDVITLKHAHKAIEGGVDGLILVCGGSGGHTGWINPFAFVSQVREFWDGPIVLGGAISNGQSVRAAEVLGADFAYMGSRFIATKESMADQEYKDLLTEGVADDVQVTNLFSGMNANWLRQSIEKRGLDPKNLTADSITKERVKPWKEVFSVGHGVGSIHDVPPVKELVSRLVDEYQSAK